MSQPDLLWHLLLALAAVVTAGRLLAVLFQRLGQPPVIGEVIGGILLGPSLLGFVSPQAYAYLLPPTLAPRLSVVAQLGIILYMFMVGLELNPEMLRKREHATIAISNVSIIVPFALGTALAFFVYPRFSSPGVPFTSFALFMGLAMSITAFPVLARILSDTGMTRTEVGTMALTCAAVNGVTAWCLLAFVAGVAQATGPNIVRIGVLTLAVIAMMFWVVRPVGFRLSMTKSQPGQGTIALTLVAS